YTLNPDGDVPSDLVAAGNASLTGTGIADLIGITGDTTNGYQLDLYATCGQCNADHYGYYAPLAYPTQSPDGGSDWNNFALTTYPVDGTSVSSVYAVSQLAPDHEWPLTGSSGPTSSGTATVCPPDPRGGADLPATGGVTFPGDDTHGIVADLGGAGYRTAPPNM